MIRQIHTFQYYKRTFRCGDLLVKDYLLYMTDSVQALKKILLEFNTELPDMDEKHMEKFLNVLFLDDGKRKKQAKTALGDVQNEIKDMKYQMKLLGIILRQPYSELLNMTLLDYNETLERLEEIQDPSKFVASSEKDKVDHIGIADLKNNL